MDYCGIIGTNYCGSTMLSYMLGSSPGVFSTGETTHGDNRFRCGNWHKEPCEFWTNDFKAKVLKNRNQINRLISERAEVVFGSTVVLNPDKFTRFFESAVNRGDRLDSIILLYKRPEAFAYSFLEHQKNRYGKKFRESKRRGSLISAACSAYASEYNAGVKFIKANKLRHIMVSYEDLAIYPNLTIEKICKWLKVPYSSNMIDYWNNSGELHMVPSGNAGARYQFLKKDKHLKVWKERLSGNHDTYGREHSAWMIKNYHKITLDEKWKRYLNSDEKSMILGHKNSWHIYNHMQERRITK